MADAMGLQLDTRRRRKAERPKEILEAAFEEFSRNGYAATTLDQMLDEVIPWIDQAIANGTI